MSRSGSVITRLTLMSRLAEQAIEALRKAVAQPFVRSS
jgi:hypothetical protein